MWSVSRIRDVSFATKRSRRVGIGLVAFFALLVAPAVASAQEWVPDRTRPRLREIVSVDRTGEPGWPYGREDVAGDGHGTFGPDERSLDVRTVYAQTNGARTWIRAYTSDTTAAPRPTMVMAVFVDLDRNSNTGGSANAPVIDAGLVSDPTTGGFEAAIVVQADGSRAELWRFDELDDRWNRITLAEDDLHVESGTDLDPIGIGPNVAHGYVQLDILHTLSRLAAACESRFFVRTFDAELGYGDLDAGGLRACRAPDLDNDGAPDIIEEIIVGCTLDEHCPGDSLCLPNGACIIGVECLDNSDCANGYTCNPGGVCERIVTAQCTTNSQCDGLVCEGGQCVACRANGPRACGGNLLCVANGECIDPDTIPPPAPDRGNRHEGPFGLEGVEVQGGACTCQQLSTQSTPAWPLFAFAMFFVGGLFGVARHGAHRRGRSSALARQEDRP